MTDTAITVVSVSWHSADFLRDLFDNLRALAAQPDALRFLVADNTAGHDAALADLGVPDLSILPVDVSGEFMSVAHATGLNALMARLETPYVLVVDPDVAVFQPGWDETLRELVRSPDVVAAGAPYPAWKLGKYHDFPSPPFAFWRTDALLALEPDWRPYARRVGQRLADMLRRQMLQVSKFLDRNVQRLPARQYRVGRWMERRVGIVSKDTGWEIADRARRRGWGAQVFQGVRSADDLTALPADECARYGEVVQSFELYAHAGRPFVAHLQSTQRGLSFALWTSHTVVLYRNTSNRAARVARWRELIASLLAEL